jgi:hypothetical protein
MTLTRPAQADIVGLWRFEAAVNDTVADASGHGNPAVLLQGAAIGTEVPATCILPKGTSCTQDVGSLSLQLGQAAVIADAPELRPSQLTIEAWIKPQPGAWVVVGKQLGGWWANSFQIELRDATGGTLAFSISDPGEVWHIVISHVVPPYDAWSHVAGTWDGQMMILYLNGEVIASSPYSGQIGYDDNPILIGADDDGAGVPGCCYFVGAIDEVRLSDRALTPDEFVLVCPPGDCAVGREPTSWGRLKNSYR